MALLLVAGVGAQYSPAFLWSEKLDVGLGREAQHLAELGSADLERAVAAVQGQPGNSGAPLLQKSPESPPEAHLVFLLDGLHTETVREHGAALPNMHGLLQQAASSASAPFTMRSAAQPTLFQQAPRIPGAKAEAYVAAHPELFSNGRADMLVIEVPSAAESPAASLAAQDELVARVSRAVSTATAGRYAALVTGGDRIQVATTHRRLAATEGQPLHIDRDLLTALLIGIVLFVVFISGFCCLFSLQTPKKFDDPSKVVA
jgi:hypothetical protein